MIVSYIYRLRYLGGSRESTMPYMQVLLTSSCESHPWAKEGYACGGIAQYGGIVRPSLPDYYCVCVCGCMQVLLTSSFESHPWAKEGYICVLGYIPFSMAHSARAPALCIHGLQANIQTQHILCPYKQIHQRQVPVGERWLELFCVDMGIYLFIWSNHSAISRLETTRFESIIANTNWPYIVLGLQ